MQRGNGMVCLEIINVRTSGKPEIMNALALCREIRQSRIDKKPVRLKVYCSTGYETDLSVHLRWVGATVEQSKSALGLELARALGGCGLVSHTTWIEKGEA